MSLVDHMRESGQKTVRVPTLDKLTEEILDEIQEARQAGYSWQAIAESLEAVHDISVSGDALMRNVPKVRPDAR